MELFEEVRVSLHFVRVIVEGCATSLFGAGEEGGCVRGEGRGVLNQENIGVDGVVGTIELAVVGAERDVSAVVVMASALVAFGDEFLHEVGGGCEGAEVEGAACSDRSALLLASRSSAVEANTVIPQFLGWRTGDAVAGVGCGGREGPIRFTPGSGEAGVERGEGGDARCRLDLGDGRLDRHRDG